jgi:Mg/Co/Ni transporter MgtE
MAFLPLSSAISGNCGKAIIVSHDNSFDVFVICNILILPNLTTSSYIGLQASTLATRAISHLHVTKQNYLSWLWIEIQVAGLLGLGMGIIVGGIAYQASGFDFAFGFTIFFANVISVLTAGLTGTIAPLLFTFIFHRDSGKWGGPIETAIQDIVGSFVMVILSYRVLLFLGTSDIDPSDTCS